MADAIVMSTAGSESVQLLRKCRKKFGADNYT